MVDFLKIYERLYEYFGPQSWWPAENDFEVAIGAILTQRTTWRNVEKTLETLKQHGVLHPDNILDLSDHSLSLLLRQCGFYRQKTRYLRNFCETLMRDFHGEIVSLRKMNFEQAKNWLLSIKGIGPETADSILLYACEFPTFVIDTYTQRIISRLEHATKSSYSALKARFERELPADLEIYRQYHALLVELGKRNCKSQPLCDDCPISVMCSHVLKTSRARKEGCR